LKTIDDILSMIYCFLSEV